MGALTKGIEKRPPVTEKQLFETCDKFFKQHDKEPTQKVIIELIGGSPVTVGPLLRKWKEKRENEEQARLEMPEHIRDGGMTIIATWWQSIQPTINDMITTTQEMADKKVKSAMDKVEVAIASQTWLEQQNSDLEEKAEKVLTEHEQQIKSLNDAKKDRDEELTDMAIAKAKVEGELEAVKQQLIELTAENKADSNASKKEQSSIDQESEKALVKKAVQPANRKSKS